MAIDLTEARFGEQPSGGHPPPKHVGIPPARNIAGPFLHPASRTLHEVGRGPAFMERGRQLQLLRCERLLPSFA